MERQNKRLKVEGKESAPNWITKVVEFKFDTVKTPCLQYGWDSSFKGVMHIPLMQCQTTGRFQAISGTTEFQVIATSNYFADCEDENKVNKVKERKFKGTLVATKSTCAQDTDNNKTSIEIMDLGISFQYEWSHDGEHTTEKGYFAPKKGDETDFTTMPKLNKKKKLPKFFADRLNEWMDNAGGYLCFYSHQDNDTARDSFDLWYEHLEDVSESDFEHSMKKSTLEADYKLKLYTVLSAHEPNEMVPLIPPPDGTKPDWEALEKLVAVRMGRDKKKHEYKDKYEYERNKDWLKGVVEDYVMFLQLKKDFNDYERCVLFSPSKVVDEVWHAHLSFLDRYQRDIMAFMGGARLVEHNPVLGEAAKLRYVATYHAMKTIQKEKGDTLRWRHGWPEPQINISSANQDSDSDAAIESSDAGDSDDCISVTLPFDNSQCG